ncbi:MAG: peptide chain release factor N(5)-glutamine methyltransferase [Zwartia sp.]
MQTAQSLTSMSGLPRLEARMLLEMVLGKPREWLLAHDTDPIAPEAAAQFLTLAAQRRQGTPMAHLVGHREFMGHRLSVSADVLIQTHSELLSIESLFHDLAQGKPLQYITGEAYFYKAPFFVNKDVLIPRPETELLVEMALQSLADCAVRSLLSPATGNGAGCSLLDLGTGSGAVAISVALARPTVRVVATDLSETALVLAQKNAQQLEARVQFWQGNWYEALPPEGRFNVIVSNPPYIALNDPHLAQGDLRFEPVGALTDGADGLTALKQIITGAPQHLTVGGWLWLEHGYEQGEEVAQLLLRSGFNAVQTKQDLAGLPRITGGSL